MINLLVNFAKFLNSLITTGVYTHLWQSQIDLETKSILYRTQKRSWLPIEELLFK